MSDESIARLYGESGARRPLDRASIEAEAQEGLLLAEYATRMRLKNRIIVDTLTGGDPVDLDAWVDEVRLSLGRLRLESEASARRMASERDVAAGIGGVGQHEHDYRRRDADNLERRRRVHLALAGRLIRWENDDDRVRSLVAAARDDAYREMQTAIADALAPPTPRPAQDAEVLEERLRLLTAVDLPALAVERERAEQGNDVAEASGEDPPPDAPEVLDATPKRRRLRLPFRRR